MLLGIASGDWLSPDKANDGQEHWGGSGWARIGQYVPSLPMAAAIGILVWNRDHFSIADQWGNHYDPDVIIMQRLMHKGIAENIVEAQKYGQKIINDVDDWYWGLSPQNYAFHVNHPKKNLTENIEFYKASLAKSDLIITSTPYLAERLSALTKCPIEVSKNTVDIARFQTKEHTDSDVPVVGWVGSTIHRSGDLETMKGILGPMVKDNRISLYHGGAMPGGPTFAGKIGVSDSDVTTASLCPSDEYPKLITMDVGIVPLNSTPFNRAKSDIKGLEYAASGIPFIAQNLDAYIELQQSLGVGRVAKNAYKWIRHLNELRDPNVRAEEGARIKKDIEPRDIKYGAQRLVDILTNL